MEQKHHQPSYRRDDDNHGVYDEEPPQTGGSERGQSVSRGAQDSLDAIDKELAEAENNPIYNNDGETASANALSSGGLAKKESNPSPTKGLRSFTNEDDGPTLGQRAKRLLKSKKGRNVLIGSGIAGLGIGGVIGMFSVLSGPIELIHLGKTLGHPFSKLQSDSANRTSHLFRYARAWQNKDVSYTRMGVIGTKIMNNTLDNLEKAGFTVTSTNAAGRPTNIAIDTEKVKNEFPETKNMNDQQFREFVAEKLQVDYNILKPDWVKDGKIQTWDMDIRSFKFSSIQKLIKNGNIGLVGDGQIIGGQKARVVGKWMGLGDLFHPFSRYLEQKLNDRITAAGDKKQSKEEAEKKFAEEETQKRTFAVDSKGEVVATEVKDKVDGQKGVRTKAIAGAGVVIAAACIAHEAATKIPELDYYRVVAPSIIEATSGMAKGSQVEDSFGQNNKEIGTKQIDATLESYTDKNGKSIWDGAALEALQGYQIHPDSKGNLPNDLQPEYRQAYEQHSTVQTIDKAATAVLDGITGPGILLTATGIHPGLVLCNAAVQWGLAAVSVVIQGVLAVASGGTTQLLITAADTAESVLVQQFIIGSAVQWLQNWFINSNTAGKLAEDAFSGPSGGNLLAYGARASANMAAMGSGGVSLDNESSTYVSSLDKEEAQQFESESLYARLFDTKDDRSLIGQMAIAFNPSVKANALSLQNTLLNMGTTLSSAFANFIPRASAATLTSWSSTYNWGFPQYGIPDNMLDDSALADPYANGNDVGKYLSAVCKSGDNIGPGYGKCSGLSGTKGLANRIKACFGNDLVYDNGTWDLTTISGAEINPNDSDYIAGNCNDTKDPMWRRIVMFVNDTHTMKGIACWEGDDTSCDEGFGSSSNPQPTPSPTPTGSAQDIAKQILNNKNISYIYDAKQDVQLAAEGKPGTAGAPLDIRTLQIVWALGQSHKVIVSAFESHGSGHTANSAHYVGKAVDIANIDGVVAYKNITTYWPLIQPYSSGAIFLQGDCSGADTAPSGMNRLPGDTCNHQHIQFGS